MYMLFIINSLFTKFEIQNGVKAIVDKISKKNESCYYGL
jgi:hypothetical protein